MTKIRIDYSDGRYCLSPAGHEVTISTAVYWLWLLTFKVEWWIHQYLVRIENERFP